MQAPSFQMGRSAGHSHLGAHAPALLHGGLLHGAGFGWMLAWASEDAMLASDGTPSPLAIEGASGAVGLLESFDASSASKATLFDAIFASKAALFDDNFASKAALFDAKAALISAISDRRWAMVETASSESSHRPSEKSVAAASAASSRASRSSCAA